MMTLTFSSRERAPADSQGRAGAYAGRRAIHMHAAERGIGVWIVGLLHGRRPHGVGRVGAQHWHPGCHGGERHEPRFWMRRDGLKSGLLRVLNAG